MIESVAEDSSEKGFRDWPRSTFGDQDCEFIQALLISRGQSPPNP